MGKLFYTLALGLVLLSCSKNGRGLEPVVPDEPQIEVSDIPVGFGVDAEWNSVVKAGELMDVVGDPSISEFYDMDTVWVFGYHIPDGNSIEQTPPNFMYRQSLECLRPSNAAGTWRYSPIKYWPNNSGDRLSFYGYFPHSKNISVSGNNVAGPPTLTYTFGDLDNAATDYLYAEALNLTKPATAENTLLVFKHLLGKIQFFISVLPPEGLLDSQNNPVSVNEGLYGVYVKSVEMQVNKQGSFNYTYDNSGKPVWTIGDGTAIHDRIIDGKGVYVDKGGEKTNADGTKETIGEFVHNFTSFVLPVTLTEFTISMSLDGINYTDTKVELASDKHIEVSAGKITTININITPDKVCPLDVSFTIRDWIERKIEPTIEIKP